LRGEPVTAERRRIRIDAELPMAEAYEEFVRQLMSTAVSHGKKTGAGPPKSAFAIMKRNARAHSHKRKILNGFVHEGRLQNIGTR
jgi:hypothetical protein